MDGGNPKKVEAAQRGGQNEEARRLRCALLDGSAWNRLRKGEMEEEFNKEAKEGWRCAADAARITDENVSDEVRRSLCSG